MTLQLVDDDQVLEAALSFLEQHDTQHSARGKKKNMSSSNRAREAQYKELLALREQVPRLEKHLTELQEQAQPSVLHLWRKLAMLERQSRANAEDENCRLRALVSENADATMQNVQQLLQTNTQEHDSQTVERSSDLWPPDPRPPDPWPYRRMPVDPSDGNLMRETAYRSLTRRSWLRLALFQTGGLVSDDTVVEIFGEEHRFGHVLFDIKIQQIVRRYSSC
ncbi:hypothetical protein PR003_g9466 [Phytophthora rubi]|uniref:Uncharacterized protein n=1 Tax=Phytophthora rubi TaxID=129364 RepID=A0A6A3NLB4_9STRA|nr:hypothetical protein PR002_g9117 [Phytophthora rubi]KAE9041969.1 hypothetical protein PR001_g6401 [Phytophthora rubi]KAE9342463.1 hypothetical protein PR003_g9466 [Phytophthora rubi]